MNCTFANLQSVTIQKCTFINCKSIENDGDTNDKCKILNCVFSECSITNRSEWNYYEIHYCVFHNMKFNGFMRNTDLTKNKFNECTFENGGFQICNLSDLYLNNNIFRLVIHDKPFLCSEFISES